MGCERKSHDFLFLNINIVIVKLKDKQTQNELIKNLLSVSCDKKH